MKKNNQPAFLPNVYILSAVWTVAMLLLPCDMYLLFVVPGLSSSARKIELGFGVGGSGGLLVGVALI
jgi:hypothetical protein